MKALSSIYIFCLITWFIPRASAKLGSGRGRKGNDFLFESMSDTMFGRHRSLAEFPRHHRKLVRRLSASITYELNSYHNLFTTDPVQGVAKSAKLAQKLHTLVGGHVTNLDPESRALTKASLQMGFQEHVYSSRRSFLQQDKNQHDRELGATLIFGVALFAIVIGALIVFAVLQIIDEFTSFNNPVFEPNFWSSLGNGIKDNYDQYWRGLSAASYDDINPCNRMPLRRRVFNDTTTPRFSYFPVRIKL